MITRLEGPLRREISIDGRPYVVTISPTGMLLAEKGRRKGFTMEWSAFVAGEVALASALNASLAAAPRPRPARDGDDPRAAPAHTMPRAAKSRTRQRTQTQ